MPNTQKKYHHKGCLKFFLTCVWFKAQTVTVFVLNICHVKFENLKYYHATFRINEQKLGV